MIKKLRSQDGHNTKYGLRPDYCINSGATRQLARLSSFHSVYNNKLITSSFWFIRVVKVRIIQFISVSC